MSVYITFEPHKESGVVAEGTLLLDAAKRLGVPIPTDCRGLGECDTCAVLVREGASLLSSSTNAEHEQLGEHRLSAGQRLVCQTKVERTGELVLVSPPVNAREETVEDAGRRFRDEFRELPLGSKIKRLARFEAVTAFEALIELANLPFTVGEKVLDVMVDFGRKRESDRNTQYTDEQRANVDAEDKPDEQTH